MPTNWVKRYGLEGPLVMQVIPGGAAAEAGIRPTQRTPNGNLILGDIIVGLNGNKIKSYEDLVLEIEQYKPGETIQLNLLRDGKSVSVSVTLNSSN
jgi:S1-C subfamily serine protease